LHRIIPRKKKATHPWQFPIRTLTAIWWQRKEFFY